jgi:hypothetical protein
MAAQRGNIRDMAPRRRHQGVNCNERMEESEAWVLVGHLGSAIAVMGLHHAMAVPLLQCAIASVAVLVSMREYVWAALDPIKLL